MSKKCVHCVFFEAKTDEVFYCTVHQKEVEQDDSCKYWAQEPEFDPNPELDEERDSLQEEDLCYQQ